MNKNKIILHFCLMMMMVSSMTLSWTVPSSSEKKTETGFIPGSKVHKQEMDLSSSELIKKEVSTIYEDGELASAGLKDDVFRKAYIGLLNLKERGKVSRESNIISIVDLDQSSRKKRLWIIDLTKRQLLLNTWVSHGKGSGADMATRFSNNMNSHQSSLGFYVTGEVYNGKHGRSLRLDGMDQGFNSKARERAIVIHGASYVSAQAIKSLDRLGLSYGCPAVPLALSNKIIDLVKDRTVLYIHANSPSYHSVFLDEELAGRELLASYLENGTDSKFGKL